MLKKIPAVLKSFLLLGRRGIYKVVEETQELQTNMTHCLIRRIDQE